MARTRALDARGTAERAARALAFLEVARANAETDTSAQRAVSASTAIEAGIAASDAICGRLLGEHSNSERHADAVDLLRRALPRDAAAANALRRLLEAKSLVQYGSTQVTTSAALGHLQRAETLVLAMEAVLAG